MARRAVDARAERGGVAVVREVGRGQNIGDKVVGRAAQPKQHSCHIAIAQRIAFILVVLKLHRPNAS